MARQGVTVRHGAFVQRLTFRHKARPASYRDPTGVLMRFAAPRSDRFKRCRQFAQAAATIRLGDPAHLGDLGVALVHALPGVGANLRDHYSVRPMPA